MSEIQRLIRLAARRNEAEGYTQMRFKVLKSLVASFRRKTVEDGLSGNVLIEAFIRGYLNSNPSILALIDQWIRDTTGEVPDRRSPKLSKRDLEEIYAASSRGLSVNEEETDG